MPAENGGAHAGPVETDPITNTRFTAWMTAAERAALDKRARELRTSRNYVLRMALCRDLGLPAPAETDLYGSQARS